METGTEAIDDTIPEALTRDPAGLISIGNLASFLGTSVDRLRPLVEQEYLRVATPNQDFAQTMVFQPGKRAIDWLRTMFQPLKMIPLVPLKEAGKLWGISEREVMKYCRVGQIPVYSDPALGYLLTFGSLKRLARARAKYFKPKRLDRASLLRYYLSQIEGVRWKEAPPNNKYLEAEISRIAKLRDPQRTERCMDLVLRYRDAKTAAECFRWGRDISDELRDCENKLRSLVRNSTGLEPEILGL